MVKMVDVDKILENTQITSNMPEQIKIAIELFQISKAVREEEDETD